MDKHCKCKQQKSWWNKSNILSFPLVHPKGNQSWEFIRRTVVETETPNILATWCKELTHLKDPDVGKDWRAGGKVDDRGWDGWMASLTQWTWVWVNSGSWWWTGRPGELQFMGLQRVGHDWMPELILILYFHRSQRAGGNWLRIWAASIIWKFRRSKICWKDPKILAQREQNRDMICSRKRDAFLKSFLNSYFRD